MKKYVDLGPEWQAWRCAFCFEYKAVPDLARECEKRHEDTGGKSLKSSA